MWYLYCNYIIGKGYVEPVDILSKCNNLSWNSDSETLSISLTFNSIYDLAEGRTHLVLKKDDTVVFMGVIVKKTNKNLSSSYTAMDYSFYLNKNEEIIQFNNIDAKSSISQLLEKLNIKNLCTTLNTKINKFYKGKSISDIIKDILGQCKEELGEDVIMEMQGDTLYIDKISNLQLDCKYLMANDFSIDRSMENMVNNVIISSNEESDKSIAATSKDENSINTFGQLTKVISVDKKNISQAQNIAQKYLANFNGTKKELTVSILDIEGCENVKAKRKIKIEIPQYGVNDYYRIKSAQHTLTNNIHKISLSIDFSEVSFEELEELTSSSNDSDSVSNTTDRNNDNNSKQEDIISYAKQYLGVPYVWGGKTPDGFDCSGFVAYVFNHFGYNLDAYTYTMINQGTRVNVNSIQSCDLVFLYNTGHVGIYIGNDQFIHAPHTGDVVKISQFSGHYQDNCNAVVRII